MVEDQYIKRNSRNYSDVTTQANKAVDAANEAAVAITLQLRLQNILPGRR